MILFSGILAGVLAYLWNRWILRKIGEKGLFVIVPLIEEVSKSGMAFLMGVNLLGTHFIFGCIEGVYDIVTSSDRIGSWAAIASIISHSFFGGMTYLIYQKANSVVLAILTAWLFHGGWNWYITKYL